MVKIAGTPEPIMTGVGKTQGEIKTKESNEKMFDYNAATKTYDVKKEDDDKTKKKVDTIDEGVANVISMVEGKEADPKKFAAVKQEINRDVFKYKLAYSSYQTAEQQLKAINTLHAVGGISDNDFNEKTKDFEQKKTDAIDEMLTYEKKLNKALEPYALTFQLMSDELLDKIFDSYTK